MDTHAIQMEVAFPSPANSTKQHDSDVEEAVGAPRVNSPNSGSLPDSGSLAWKPQSQSPSQSQSQSQTRVSRIRVGPTAAPSPAATDSWGAPHAWFVPFVGPDPVVQTRLSRASPHAHAHPHPPLPPSSFSSAASTFSCSPCSASRYSPSRSPRDSTPYFAMDEHEDDDGSDGSTLGRPRSRSRSRSRSPVPLGRSSCKYSVVRTCLTVALGMCMLLLLLIAWRTISWLRTMDQQQQQQPTLHTSLQTYLTAISEITDVDVHVRTQTQSAAATPRPLPSQLYADPSRLKPHWNQLELQRQRERELATNGYPQQQQEQQPSHITITTTDTSTSTTAPHPSTYTRTHTYIPMLPYAWNTMSETAGTPDAIARDMKGPPIDVVYTWVNGSDPAWQKEQAKFGDKSDIANKYREWDELRYSMRSVAMYAPWVRNIILVTANQVPCWLNTSDPRIRVVHHRELFPHPESELPSFNSNAIEAVLHRIPNLSEDFIYMNNDLYLGRPMARDQLGNSTHYYKYVDYNVHMSSACLSAIFRDSKDENTLQNSMQTCKHDTIFYWQSMLSQHYFQNVPTHWFAHMPHRWNRLVLMYMEKTMKRWYDVARRNRFRDHTSDLFTHVQYESALTRMAYERAIQRASARKASKARQQPNSNAHSISNSNTGLVINSYHRANPYNNNMQPIMPEWLMPDLYHVEDVVVANLSDYEHHHLYQYFVFMNHDTTLYYWEKLTRKISEYQPLFVCIDDDLKNATPEQVAFHRIHFQKLLQHFWPVKATWER